MPVYFLLMILSMSPAMLWAQAAEPAAVPQPTTMEAAKAQREQASRLRKEAETRHEAEMAACYKKVLVNSCLDGAKKRYTQSVIAARNLDAPARDFEREFHRQEQRAKDEKRATENDGRREDQAKKAGQYRADEASKASARAQKQAAKAAKAAEGRKKREAEQAKYQAKIEKRDKKEAEKAAKRKEADPEKDI